MLTEFSGKRMLFLPGGQWQTPVIRLAKAMGFYVICADGTKNPPGFKFADEGYTIPLQDTDRLIRLGQEKAVDIVMTEQTDFSIPIVASVAKGLGLKGLTPKVAKEVTNKPAMRKAATKAGVKQPEFRECFSAEEFFEAVETLGLPLFVKPADSQSSRGVAHLQKRLSKEALEKVFKGGIRYSVTNSIIVEQFIEGTECTVEGFVHDHEPTSLAISDKKHYPHLPGVAETLTYPGDFSKEVMKRIRQANEAVIRALEIPFGITHAEYIIDKEGEPNLVEIAARGGGSFISTHIIPAASDFEPIPALIRTLMGQRIEPPQPAEKAVQLRFLVLRENQIFQKPKKLVEYEARKNVLALHFNYAEGEIVGGIEDDRSRHGLVITTGETRQEAVKLAKMAQTILDEG